jgi:hypothetical protein
MRRWGAACGCRLEYRTLASGCVKIAVSDLVSKQRLDLTRDLNSRTHERGIKKRSHERGIKNRSHERGIKIIILRPA